VHFTPKFLYSTHPDHVAASAFSCLQPAVPGTAQSPSDALAAFKQEVLKILADVSEQLANLAKVVAALQVLCSNNMSES
jgi:hypothetical protein